MSKVSVEIDIPDGYDFVRYGNPEVGDYYVSSMSSTLDVNYCSYKSQFCYQRVIVKKSELKLKDLNIGDRFTVKGVNCEFVKCSNDIPYTLGENETLYTLCRTNNHITMMLKDTTVKKLN